MKKILLACLVLFVVLPIHHAYSFTYASKTVIADHRLHLSSETYKVFAWFGFTSGLLNPGDYATISGGPLTGEVRFDNPYEWIAGYYEFDYVWPEDDPSILSAFSNQTYTFKLYDQLDNQIILDEHPVTLKTGNMQWLPLVDLTVATSGGYTWLRWNDITGYGLINNYRVVLMNPDPSGPYALETFIFVGGKDFYTFSYYTEDLISEYGEVTFRVEARQFEDVDPDGWVLVNRSSLLHTVSAPCECDLNIDGRCDMQDWLLFGEDWGRTDCPIF